MQIGNIAAAPLLSISSTQSGFRTPSPEVLQADPFICQADVDILSTQHLVFLLHTPAEAFLFCPLKQDASAIWTTMWKTFGGCCCGPFRAAHDLSQTSVLFSGQGTEG